MAVTTPMPRAQQSIFARTAILQCCASGRTPPSTASQLRPYITPSAYALSARTIFRATSRPPTTLPRRYVIHCHSSTTRITVMMLNIAIVPDLSAPGCGLGMVYETRASRQTPMPMNMNTSSAREPDPCPAIPGDCRTDDANAACALKLPVVRSCLGAMSPVNGSQRWRCLRCQMGFTGPVRINDAFGRSIMCCICKCWAQFRFRASGTYRRKNLAGDRSRDHQPSVT